MDLWPELYGFSYILRFLSTILFRSLPKIHFFRRFFLPSFHVLLVICGLRRGIVMLYSSKTWCNTDVNAFLIIKSSSRYPISWGIAAEMEMPSGDLFISLGLSILLGDLSDSPLHRSRGLRSPGNDVVNRRLDFPQEAITLIDKKIWENSFKT